MTPPSFECEVTLRKEVQYLSRTLGEPPLSFLQTRATLEKTTWRQNAVIIIHVSGFVLGSEHRTKPRSRRTIRHLDVTPECTDQKNCPSDVLRTSCAPPVGSLNTRTTWTT